MLKYIAVLGMLGLGTPLALSAQARSAVSGADLESAVLRSPATNQAAVQQFLRDDRVVEAAAGIGVNAADLATRASRLDDATLRQVAARTRADDRGLAGGDQKVVLGTTAILLIIIIIILLVR